MSVYSLSVADKGVFNLPKEVQAIDVDTRNAYNATIVGFEAGANNQGPLNIMIGYRAGNNNVSGGQNVYIGPEAAERGRTATDNVIIGYRAGKFITSGVRNVYLGNNAGFFLNGNQNILLGFNNTVAADLTLSHSNISIGYRSSTFGNNNVVLGNNSYLYSEGSIGVGERVVDNTKNSIIIGNNITNSGSNVLIINNRHNSNLDEISMSNTQNDYMNINDYIVVENSNNKRVMTMSNELVKIFASNIELRGAGALRIGEVVEMTGFYSTLLLDRTVTIGLRRDSNFNAPQLYMTSNSVYLGGSNVDNTYISGSNASFYLNSNIIVLSNNDMRFISNSNVIGFGGSNNKEFKLYGSNNTITMSNGGTFLESGLVVYRDAYMSNNLFVNKTSTFKDDVGFYDAVVAHSNVTFERDIIINSNSVMFVGSEVTLCNQDRFVIDGDGETHIQQPLVTKDEVYVEDKVSFCNLPINFLNWDEVNERELQEFYGSSIVQKNLFVGGMMYSAGLNVSDRLVLLSGNGTNQWNQYVSITSNQNPYLVFQSDTGTVVKLGDDFTPELFNFTGKHRCSSSIENNERQDDLIGKIVIATGRYINLDNEESIDIDEAIPVIELATEAKDTRAFGVISGFEKDEDKRVYRLGNLHFETNKSIDDKKVIVNSVGEGGIWVCNENGPLRNGDLIVTSHLSGYGMRQEDDIVRSCTVAKITCDCDFAQPKQTTIVMDDGNNKKEYIVAFVGCTYKF